MPRTINVGNINKTENILSGMNNFLCFDCVVRLFISCKLNLPLTINQADITCKELPSQMHLALERISNREIMLFTKLGHSKSLFVQFFKLFVEFFYYTSDIGTHCQLGDGLR